MCTGYYSSQIAAEEKRVYGIETNTLRLETKKDVLSGILQVSDNINDVYFAGGEPLLIPDHYEILQHLIDNNKSNISVRYNTNLSVLSYKNKYVIDYWKQFNNIRVGASLDAMGKHAEYIRNGTVWSDIEQNFNTIHKECPHIDIIVTSIINVYNAFNLIEFQREWISNSKINASQFKVRALTGPDYLSIQILPEGFKQRLNNAINMHLTFLKDYDSKVLVSEWKEIQLFLFAVDNSSMLSKFFEYTDVLDRRRNESFDEVCTEYKGLRK
jgi:organic radical activating enzyme